MASWNSTQKLVMCPAKTTGLLQGVFSDISRLIVFNGTVISKVLFLHMACSDQVIYELIFWN